MIPGPDGAERAAVAVQAHRRPRRCRSARSTNAVVAFLDRRAAPLAPGQLAGTSGTRGAAPARVRFSTHTARRAAIDGMAQRVGQRRAEQPVPRLLVALVDDLDGRPAARRRGRPARPTATSASTRRRRASARAAPRRRGARARRATSRAFQVGARSSWSASSPSSSTTTAARSGTGAHTAARPPTTTHAPARARSQCAVRTASACSEPSGHDLAALVARACDASCAARARRRVDHQRRALGRELGTVESRSRGPISVELASPCRRRRPGTPPCSTLDRVGRRRPTFGGDAARRNARQRARPPPRRPAAELDDVGAAGPRRRTASDLAAARSRPARRRRRRAPSRAPAARAAGRAPPCRRAAVASRRGPVVERAVDGSDVRSNATIGWPRTTGLDPRRSGDRLRPPWLAQLVGVRRCAPR